MISIVELLLPNGKSPFGEWFSSLDPVSASKVVAATYRMQQGNLSSVKWFRGIGEYRIDWGAGLRIYLAKDGASLLLLLGGGSKKGQQKDIERALYLWEEYRKSKKNPQDGDNQWR